MYNVTYLIVKDTQEIPRHSKFPGAIVLDLDILVPMCVSVMPIVYIVIVYEITSHSHDKICKDHVPPSRECRWTTK